MSVTLLCQGLSFPCSFVFAFSIKMDEHFAEMLSDSYGRDTPSRHHHHHDNNGGEHVKNGDYSDSSLHAGRKAQTVGSPNGRRHGHDRLGARSVGMELTDGPIDWAKFKAWLKAFLEKEGERIWRLKGVLWTSVPDRGSGNGRTTTWGWEAGRRTVLQVNVYFMPGFLAWLCA